MLAGQITKLAAAIGAKIKELEGKISQGGRKCEYINVSKEMWISNGYPFTDSINFKHTYIRPRVVVHVVHTGLSTSYQQVNVGPLTGTGCRLRAGVGFVYANVDVAFSVSIYVEESAGL